MQPQLMFIGTAKFLGHTCHVNLSVEINAEQLADIFSSLMCRPDDPPQILWAQQLSNTFLLEPETYSTDTEPGQITLDDFSDDKTNAEKWRLLSERLPWLFEEKQQPTKPPATAKEIDKLNEPSQAEQDLEKLSLHLDKIIKPNGRVNLSEIARQLNIAPGGSKWPYIQQLGRHLEAEARRKAA